MKLFKCQSCQQILCSHRLGDGANRAMGQPDLCLFVLSARAIFMHSLVRDA